jgi:nitrogenase iron protein NifH
MIQLAVYGKGGIGKSTTVSNISAALADAGVKVMQIGCDPKADSTSALLGGKKIETVIDLIKPAAGTYPLEDIAFEGYKGVICVEAGGPTPGLGCAGRAITAVLELLKEKGAYEKFAPDVIIYDVLGDVVCGGFSVPMRAGYAQKVFIVTSGENMAIHAGANIAVAVENFKDRGYATLGGIILNRRNVKNEDEKGGGAGVGHRLEAVVGVLDRSDTVQDAEELGKTVIEAFPESAMAGEYRALARSVMENAAWR